VRLAAAAGDSLAPIGLLTRPGCSGERADRVAGTAVPAGAARVYTACGGRLHRHAVWSVPLSPSLLCRKSSFR
jgi:hypothetical protein